MATGRCAFLEEEKFAEFGNMNKSVEHEAPLGEGLVEAEVERKVEEEAWVA